MKEIVRTKTLCLDRDEKKSLVFSSKPRTLTKKALQIERLGAARQEDIISVYDIIIHIRKTQIF